jgi:hypothetical protein
LHRHKPELSGVINLVAKKDEKIVTLTRLDMGIRKKITTIMLGKVAFDGPIEHLQQK